MLISPYVYHYWGKGGKMIIGTLSCPLPDVFPLLLNTYKTNGWKVIVLWKGGKWW